MSTKIYNGYRIDGYGRDPFAFADVMRETLNPVRDRADGALLAERMAASIDRMLLGLQAKDDGEVDAQTIAHHRNIEVSALGQSVAMKYLFEQSDLRREGKTGWGYDPNRFELSLAADPHSEGMLAISFCENTDLREAFEAIEGVTGYRYWNNSDRPESVIEEEWQQRREAWDAILGFGDTPAEKMLAFRLRSDPYARIGLNGSGTLSEHITPQMPPIPDRARMMAGELVNRRMAPHLDASNFSRALFIKRPEVVAAIEAVLPDIDETFLARPLADLYRLVDDQQMASIFSAVGHWFDTCAAPELGLTLDA